MEYKVQTITSKSRLHKNNEDSFLVSDDFIIVADGMGGECDGDIASRMAIDAVVDHLSKFPEGSSESDVRKLLDGAIEHADSKILEYIDRNPDSFGMGTTILITMRRNDRFFISWCGDSHCYSYDNGHLKSLTKDHSYVQELIDAGHISVKESFAHPDNNLITRYVGGGKETCAPDFKFHNLSESETIIMCSDGLSGYCQLKDIEEVISSNKNVSQLPKQLHDLAISHGSDDDITIVVLTPEQRPSRHPDGSLIGWFKKVLHPRYNHN